jgi:hypothetical protein
LDDAWGFRESVGSNGGTDVDKDGSTIPEEAYAGHFNDFNAVGTQNLSSGENVWSDAGWWCSVSKHFNHELC